MQGVISNYDTDLIHPIIHKAAELFGKTVGDDARSDTVLRINADHARATAFLINDGVVPSNEGRGYVLRKIMRRAMRNARMLGTVDPYLYKLTGFVAHHMSDAYPEMIESIPRVARVVKDEEHRYATRFRWPKKYFMTSQNLRRRRSARRGIVQALRHLRPGVDEQEEMAREAGITIDREGFDGEMEKQRTRARASWRGADKAQVNPVYQALPSTEFIGRETLEAPAMVTAVLDGEIALDKTPFYAEAGGQVGDTGVLLSKETGDPVAIVETTRSAAPGKSVHKVKIVGPVKEGETVIAHVDSQARHSTMRNHTGTHCCTPRCAPSLARM